MRYRGFSAGSVTVATMAVEASVSGDIADLIRAIASLAWPVVAGIFLYLFRADIASLLKRVRHGRAAGVELDFDRELDQLQEATRAASESVPPAAAPSDRPEEAADDAVVRDVLDDAARSPRAALMALSAELERRSREVLASRGAEVPWSGSFGQQIDRLDLSPPLREAAREFRHVRNRIVHGHAATDDDALRAIDLGIELLQAIQRIPHQIHYVEASGLECFADEAGEQAHDFSAVLLRSENPGAERGSEQRAYPTLNPEAFPEGQPVSWEWGIGGGVFPEAWYRHPDGDLRYGWTESLEFKGRPLHG
jgi:hypothetical protein